MSRKDPLHLAATRVDVATVDFYSSIAKLTDAADDLDAIAAEAAEESTRQALRAGTARSQAAAARRRSNKIAELLA